MTKSNISFDLLQNMSFWSLSLRKKKGQKSNISFDLLQNTRFHRPAPPKPGWWKKQYFVWLVAKHVLNEKCIFLKNGIVKITYVLIAKKLQQQRPAFSGWSFSGEKVMVLTFQCENDHYSLGNRPLSKNDASQGTQQ